MEERNVLSPEEVDAILKAAQQAGDDAAGDAAAETEGDGSNSINTHALSVIYDTFCTELENKFTVLLRKKVTVKAKPPTVVVVGECIKQLHERDIHSGFKLHPSESHALVSIEYPMLDQSINLLYGGKMQEKIGEENWCGKIGLITSEKISRLVISCFSDACKEYGKIEYDHYKTNRVISNVNNMEDVDNVYFSDINLSFEEFTGKISLYVSEFFFANLIPATTGRNGHQERDFWRKAIKSEVMDSYVTVGTNIQDVKVKMKDFLALKEGDVLPISDPTLVFVCLNNLRIYRGVAGQSNGKMVVKVVSQI
ncbi:MAG TPA: FliM/FliN family flagellar motor switch protein [Gammaproteobacteria bacterium]|jgi:flagellar motor switch protein FliM|nr:FliM/FliN family flagellar motor switch protein [Gammaproteobacteria bacterium]